VPIEMSTKRLRPADPFLPLLLTLARTTLGVESRTLPLQATHFPHLTVGGT